MDHACGVFQVTFKRIRNVSKIRLKNVSEETFIKRLFET